MCVHECVCRGQGGSVRGWKVSVLMCDGRGGLGSTVALFMLLGYKSHAVIQSQRQVT